MGLYATIKKKKQNEDERTVSASEFIDRMQNLQKIKLQHDQLPKTEIPKD